MPIEERREPVHGGLDGSIPAADILARHTPHLLVLIRFFGQKGVVFVNSLIIYINYNGLRL